VKVCTFALRLCPPPVGDVEPRSGRSKAGAKEKPLDGQLTRCGAAYTLAFVAAGVEDARRVPILTLLRGREMNV
jgi:hypothetical protein